MKKLFILALAVVIAFACCRGNNPNKSKNSGNTNSGDKITASSDIGDSSASDSADRITEINVYNAGGHLIRTVTNEKDLKALQDMLTDASVYSGADLHLNKASYRLDIQGDSVSSYDLWIRSNQIYFRSSEESTIYSPENTDVSSLKKIINNK